MDGWIMWALGIFSNVITGALAFFIKRNIAQGDERQKENESVMQRKMESMEANLSHQIKEVRSATEARIDKSELAVEKLENRFNEFVRDIPRNYVDKEAWMLQNQTIDRKLDKITEILINLGGKRQNG